MKNGVADQIPFEVLQKVFWYAKAPCRGRAAQSCTDWATNCDDTMWASSLKRNYPLHTSPSPRKHIGSSVVVKGTLKAPSLVFSLSTCAASHPRAVATQPMNQSSRDAYAALHQVPRVARLGSAACFSQP